MNVEQIKKTFRSPSAAEYPELRGYSRADVYKGNMGPGGLYLATQMARSLRLAKGQRVLDLGCGRGATSVFLAKQYGVSVVAVDLWTSATKLYQRFQQHGTEDRIFPLNLDFTTKLPFAYDYFDAVFCMDSVHLYGGAPGFWGNLLPHLKKRGRLCIGGPCFNSEFSFEAIQESPAVHDDGSNLWSKEFSRYHPPQWWADLIQQTGQMAVQKSQELADGIIYWEDDVLHNIEQGGRAEDAQRDADQITWRREGMPYLTHFVLCAQKKTRQSAMAPLC
ncbi:MAG: methyltransferase domain-containing protein [Candidatus Brocadiia bacterium]